MEPVKPDYGGACIDAIVPALMHGRDAPWLPAPVAGADGVLLLVLDGFGWQMLQCHAALVPTVAGLDGGAITSVLPSTTAAGLTSLATGVAPGEHGLLGYRIRVGGDPLNVLQWSTRNGPDPVTTQPVTPFLGRDVPVVTRAEFRRSGFSDAHLRGTTMIGWRTTSALVEHCRRLATQRHDLVYAYYDGIDKVAHEFGLHNEFIQTELRDTDRLVADLLEVLPAGWVLLVTADHGHVHVDEDDVVDLDAVDGLVSGYSGEGRFRTLHARPGAAAELAAACASEYATVGWVFTREQLFDEGWLGPRASLEVRGRIGDVVLAAREAVIFADPEFPLERFMRSHHGSLTADEVLVPLLAGGGPQ